MADNLSRSESRSVSGAGIKGIVRPKITSVAAGVPERLLTNADLSKLVDTSDEWIRERTGIRQRHVVDPGVATSDLVAEAARKALAQRGVPASEIDAIFVATVTPDMMFPATACLVQDKIGASGAWGFDISAACSGFLYALQTGAQFVASGVHKKVLVAGADVMTSILDYQDRTTCIIFGDGGGVALVEACEPGEDTGLIDFIHEVDGAGGEALYMPAGGSKAPTSHETVEKRMHYVKQDGKVVFKYAVKKMADLCEKLLERNGLTGSDVKCFIPHQANLRIINATAERLNMPLERVIINIDEYGNTTAGTIPLAMHSALEQGRLKKGDLVLLAAVGAGFTSGACLLRWAY